MKPPTATTIFKAPAARNVRAPMSDAQRAEALRLVQAQADQRVELGLKLLNAAKEHVGKYQEQVDAVRAAQQEFQERIEHDVTASFRQYDQWIELVESTGDDRMARMEARLDAIEADWSRAQEKIVAFVLRAESLVEQSKRLMELTQAMRAEQLMQQVQQARDTQQAQETVQAEAEVAEVTADIKTNEAREDEAATAVPCYDDAEPVRVPVKVAAVAPPRAELPDKVATIAAPASTPTEPAEASPPIPPEPQIKRTQTSLIYSALLERLAARASAAQKSGK